MRDRVRGPPGFTGGSGPPTSAIVSPSGGDTMLPQTATRTAWKTRRFFRSSASGSGSSAASIAAGPHSGSAASASRAASSTAPMPSLARPLATLFSS